MDEVTNACLLLADDCRRQGTRGRLGIVLSQFLHSVLPEDAHERCRNKIYVNTLPAALLAAQVATLSRGAATEYLTLGWIMCRWQSPGHGRVLWATLCLNFSRGMT